MDGGDVMSGIDPLNMAPSHHNDDVIHTERKKNSCRVNSSRCERRLMTQLTQDIDEDLHLINEDEKNWQRVNWEVLMLLLKPSATGY